MSRVDPLYIDFASFVNTNKYFVRQMTNNAKGQWTSERREH
jgi:hypothetical protein